MKKGILILFCICISLLTSSQKRRKAALGASRWQLGSQDDIAWQVNNDQKLPHADHLEMSGRQV